MIKDKQNSPENDWQPQSRYKYRGILNNVWIPSLHDRPINQIEYQDIASALKIAIDTFTHKTGKDPSKSLYNDWLTCLRGVFDIAIKKRAITRADNPAAEFKNKTRVKTEADPFDPEEMDRIIADIYVHEGQMWGAWFELGF